MLIFNKQKNIFPIKDLIWRGSYEEKHSAASLQISNPACNEGIILHINAVVSLLSIRY